MAEVKKQIFLWHGDNSLEIFEKRRAWEHAFTEKYGRFNTVVIDAADAGREIAEIKNALQVDSLFGSSKLIVLKNFFKNKSQKNVDRESEDDSMSAAGALIIDYLPRLPATFFLLFTNEGKARSTGKLYKAVAKEAKAGRAEILEFSLPRSADLKRWIIDRAKREGRPIDSSAAEMMSAMLGNDLWLISQELKKLAASGSGQITEKEVTASVKGKFNDDIFAFLDALGEKNKSRMLKLLHDQLASGAADMYLLSMLARQTRILLQMKALAETGVRLSDEFAARLKIHPFVARKTAVFLPRFTLAELKKLHGDILQMDRAIKTKNVSLELLFAEWVAAL